ncbi:hypothetical protein V5R04_07970 [Jonesiaceae bacterium BS-20]|uniref:Integral membrane protein n=1 Tax=Jonesiaceae bacterium BS-20 TaxID=3120821 RepID=A0AAU7DQI4_9MICO
MNSGNLEVVFAPLSLLVFLTATFVLGWACLFAFRDRAVILKQLWAAAVVEGLLLIQVVTSAIGLAGHTRPDFAAWEFWGYVVTALIILPGAALWAFAERTKWSSVVLAVGAFTVIFLQFRLIQLWG